MATTRKPRRGSMQFWPRKRAKRVYARVRFWVKGKGFLGFAGYKVGMTHLIVKDNMPNSMTKGEDIFMPVTVIECPAIKIFSLRFYKKTQKGLNAASEILLKVDKELGRKLKLPKKSKQDLQAIEKRLEEFDDLKAVVYTQPKLTGIGKKKPDVFEVAIGGDSVKEKYDFVKQFIGKEITIKDVFKTGEQIDIHGVGKGKGFQGTTKRFGTFIRGRKTEKAKRGIATLGPWHPAHVLFTVPQPGKMGFHMRTEHNKWIVMIGEKVGDINQNGGFVNYGVIKNPYVLVKGSIIGPKKRVIRFNKATRPSKKIFDQPPEISYVSLESKQRHR
nr:50S ribosomal protein L3P, large subunit ribosomal protein L3 [uncultured archaeon]